jgi:GWxTD domain-containing protein
MKNVGIGFVLVWLLSVSGTAAQEADVDLRVVRFYRAGATLVDGFCRVPFSLVQPLPERVEGSGTYVMGVTVRDSTGLVLHRSDWQQDVSRDMLRMGGAHSVEQFSFMLQPGSYELDVAIRDSSSGNTVHGVQDVRAYEAKPLVSDLLVTTDMRRAAPGDTIAAPGEVRKGSVFLSAATIPVLRPDEAQLFYYMELYPPVESAVELRAHVVGGDQRELVAGPPVALTVPARGGVAASGLNLAGLPPGQFRLRLAAAYPDTVATRSAAFAVGELSAGVVAEAAGMAVADDRFTALTEDRLDSLYIPLVHIQESDELNVYDALSVEGKRNYLRNFWARRNPAPGRLGNAAMDEYYATIEEANRRFREGGAAETPGWRTDRGRIFIRYGEPATVLREPVPEQGMPWEVWRYATGRGRKFVFIDETDFGNYILVYTDEIREPSRPNWQALFSPEDLRRIEGF